MKNEAIFIFSTPETQALKVKEYLDSLGYFIHGSGDSVNAAWDAMDFISYKCVGRFCSEKILKSTLFSDDKQKWGLLDCHSGKNYGWGIRLWDWLNSNIPGAKFIFVNNGLDEDSFSKTLSRVLGNKEKWIPNYNSCFSKCEKSLRAQLKQQIEFSSSHPENSLIISSVDEEKIKEFLNKMPATS